MSVLFSGILGLVVGSFLNVFVLRLNTGRGLGGRSFCFSCGYRLSLSDLVPIFSFLFLKGRCRYCRSKISWQYPLVESLSGLLFAMLALADSAPYLYVVVTMLLIISIYDIKHKIVPDLIVYPFIVISFLIHPGNLLAGVTLFTFFALLWLISGGKWMGFGDAKLAAGIGFLLGNGGSAVALLIAFWLGAIVGLVLLCLRRGKVTIKSEIPFAPFLALGAVLSLVFDFAALVNFL